MHAGSAPERIGEAFGRGPVQHVQLMTQNQVLCLDRLICTRPRSIHLISLSRSRMDTHGPIRGLRPSGWDLRQGQVALEVRQLIHEMSLANPFWGAPRIHGELLKLGMDVGQTSVAKYMARHRRPPSQSWKTFLLNHADGIASIDLFVVPTISFRLLYGLLVLGHAQRRILSLGSPHIRMPNGSLCKLVKPAAGTPRRLICFVIGTASTARHIPVGF